MKILLVILSLLLLSLPSFGQSSERPEGIVLPVATLGDVTETRRQIIQNTLIESLSSYYRLVPQDKLEEVQEKIFQEMDYEECTEDQCIVMIQEALQVENLFVLQVIGEGQNTQMSLKWVGLDDKKIKTDVCKGCDTFELNERVEGLVNKLDSVISKAGLIVSREKELKKSNQSNVVVQKKENPKKENIEKVTSNNTESTISASDYNTSYIGLSIVYPMQFPAKRRNIKGLRLSLFGAYNKSVNGLDITWIGFSGTKKSKIAQLTGAGLNYTNEMYGLQATSLGINYSSTFSTYQILLAGFNFTDITTLQLGFLSINIASDSNTQIGMINYSEYANYQIGFINFTKYLKGFQLGMINIVTKPTMPYGYVLPFFNASF